MTQPQQVSARAGTTWFFTGVVAQEEHAVDMILLLVNLCQIPMFMWHCKILTGIVSASVANSMQHVGDLNVLLKCGCQVSKDFRFIF